MKKSIKLHVRKNSKIRKGSKVVFIDGSSISVLNKQKEDNEYYIVYAYPEDTGSDNILKEIEGIVIETGIKDQVCISGLGWGYLQDCIVQLGNAQFRTSSNMLRKI